MQIFCERLKATRTAKNLNPKDIANKLDITLRAYFYYESGKREPNLEKLSRIAEILNVTSDYLLGLSDDPARR